MSILSSLSRLVYRGVNRCGLNPILLGTRWRSQRLLILCYHGVSLVDEHEWSGLYLSEQQFHRRLMAIRAAGCSVLPLGEAVERLYLGTLPPRAVVITFDDGFYDFAAKAWPLLREFRFPSTVYLTTYYSAHPWPVFDPMAGYLLWKAQNQILDWPELDIAPTPVNAETAPALQRRIQNAARQRCLSGLEKNHLLRTLADRLNVDFEDICSRRILHLMNPEETAGLAKEGVDFELHCHRHRVYRSRERFRQELQDNLEAIRTATGQSPRHFCYPGGFHLPEFPEWLGELGIASATTCEFGLATSASPRHLLPRLLDTPGLSDDVFAAWLSGLASAFPRTAYAPSDDQLGDAQPE